jgi:hypothetical protein
MKNGRENFVHGLWLIEEGDFKQLNVFSEVARENHGG